MSHLTHHIRHNVIAYLALFFALTGTGVAAVGLANHSVTPSNLSSRYFGGYVRGFVSVSAARHLIAGGGKARVNHFASEPPGQYGINWTPHPTSRCTAVGSVDVAPGAAGAVPGYLVTNTGGTRGREQTVVQVYNSVGQPAALPSDVELLCATPR